MESQLLTLVLEEIMQEAYFPCEWKVEWLENNHFINLELQFMLANPEKRSISDRFNASWNQELVPLQYQVIFYLKNRVKVQNKNVLKAIPVDPIHGIKYGDVIAVVKYLKRLATAVRSRWQDYYQTMQAGPFEIIWNDEDYLQVVQSLQDTYRYSDRDIYFPKSNVDQPN
ncbi:DUF3013 family protein [Eremococcus coleocola]|uniref:Uncharacterized protein n=1 Tax=Eremococcus coleocola ACS-139-V-Col8 TaxID=908337 RepID=E4KM43_9LACT|nr:DUF3013 family protein [Eremococcus coleocola]EFR32003.1 hypothetical protein HMPREF9257_1028 [Eremococcus coleocola ACS-139-V-Col8]